MTSLPRLLLQALLLAAPTAAIAGASAPAAQLPDGARVVVTWGERDGRALVGVQEHAREGISPSTAQLALYERDPGGTLRLRARSVAHAAWGPGGELYALQQEAPGRPAQVVAIGEAGARVVVAAAADFAVSTRGELAVLRRLPDYQMVLELYAPDGTLRRELAREQGHLSTPFFTPDGRAVLFVSARSGVASLFRVPTAGGAAVQVTNHGRRRVEPGVVPPPHRRESIRFVEKGRLRYDAGAGELLEVELQTGRAFEVRP
ncbi:MAG: TolB family protein [Myxococcales bacterium]